MSMHVVLLGKPIPFPFLSNDTAGYEQMLRLFKKGLDLDQTTITGLFFMFVYRLKLYLLIISR